MGHALEIRKKLSPDSHEVAESGNLGSVRWRRGDLAAADDSYRKVWKSEQKICG